MSFYGSTYFQLIDTFYKILIKNKGNNAVTFPADLEANEHASQASGRKGILEFGTGNRWIYATKEDGNPNSYIFWHAAPGGKNLTTQEFKGGAKGDVQLPAGKSAVTLAPGSYIKAPQFKFDEAGHIAAADDVYYMMPISETEEAIEDLQAKVGEPQDGKTEDLFTRAKNADEAIADVTEKAIRIRDELGSNYSSAVFPDSGAYKYVNNENYYKDFFTAFGSMDKFRTALYEDVESSKSLIDGIVEFRASALNDIEVNAENLGVQSRLINKLTDDLENAQEEIDALQAKDEEIDSTIADLSTSLTNTAKDIRDEFKAADDLIKDSIKSHTDTYNTRITNLETLVGSNKTSTDGQISDLTTTVTSNKTACDTRMKAIEDDADRLEGLIGDNATDIEELSKTVADNKTAAESAASGLSDRITDLETNSATSEALNAVNEIVGQNTTAIASLGDSITQVDENASSAIDAVNNRIDLLNSTVTTQGNTLSNKADSTTVATLETKVDNNKSAVDTALAAKAEKSVVETLQTTVSGKAEASAVTELANLVSTKANQSELNTLSELVNTKASQESLNDLAAAVNGAARADALEKYIAITDAKIAEMSAKIEELTARIEVLEKTTPPDDSGEGTE